MEKAFFVLLGDFKSEAAWRDSCREMWELEV